MLLRIESPIEIEPYITETQTIAEKIAIKDIKKVFIDDFLRQFISIHIATAITTPIKKQNILTIIVGIIHHIISPSNH